MARHAVYQFRSLLAENWRSGRIMLAGDSAHVMPPFMGQGMCSGFRDANSLAWRLGLVLQGKAGPELIDSYTLERSPHVEQVIRISMGVGWLVSVTDPEEAAERDADLRSDGLPTLPQFPGLVGGVLLSSADGTLTPGAGELSLQARVGRDGQRGLFDDVVGNGWRVVSRRPVDVGGLSVDQRELLELLDCRIVTVSPVPGAADVMDLDMDYNRWFEALGADAVIVRPDFYNFGSVASIEGLGSALDSLRSQLALS